MSQLTFPNALQDVLSLYAYLLPLLLCVLWAALAFWDLGSRTDISMGKYTSWALLLLLVPFLGPLAYHCVGKPRLSARLRLTAVGGGLGLYALALLIGSVIGGIT